MERFRFVSLLIGGKDETTGSSQEGYSKRNSTLFSGKHQYCVTFFDGVVSASRSLRKRLLPHRKVVNNFHIDREDDLTDHRKA